MDLHIAGVLMTIVVCILKDSYSHVQAIADPCEIATLLPYLRNRIEGYSEDLSLCDRFLPTAWYYLDDYVISKNSSVQCGTFVGWYMRGDLPEKAGEMTTLEGCSTLDDGCVSPLHITVKKCQDANVFHLEHLTSCPEAYCVERLSPSGTDDISTPPDIAMLQPMVSVDKVSTTNQDDKYVEVLRIHCDLNPEPGVEMKDYFFKVEWSIVFGSSLGRPIYSPTETKYINQSYFRTKTSVHEEEHLKLYKAGFSVICSITAKKDAIGQYSTSRISDSMFIGIEVINDRTGVLLNNGEKDIQLRLTVPFGCPENRNCVLIVNMFMHAELDEGICSIPTLANKPTDQNGCAVVFYNSDVNKNKTFTIKTEQGNSHLPVQSRHTVWLQTITFSSHALFSNYFLDQINVDLVSEKGILSNKLCQAHSDPHMLSFDGLRFENPRKDLFILYRNQDYKQEVQMKTSDCIQYGSSVSCVCAVVVRAGRDTFMINVCDGQSLIQSHLCDDKVLAHRIKISGNVYKVTLPTGTLVTLSVESIVYDAIEVDIYPSLLDYETSDGLCGKFDNDQCNDLDERPDKGGDHLESWRVEVGGTEDLFLDANRDNLEEWKETIMLCICPRDPTPNISALYPGATCTTSAEKQCINDGENNLNNFCNKRKRRGVSFQSEYDTHFSHETDMVNNVAYRRRKFIQTTKRYVYDNTTALKDCMQFMNTTVFQSCSKFSTLNIQNAIDNCVADAIVEGSMKWTPVHLDGVKQNCLHYVQVNQPIPDEILGQLTPIPNTTEYIHLFDNMTPTAGDLEITPELLQTLKDDICPYECNGHGACVKGVCVCQSDFIGDDCSVHKADPPIMFGIPDKGKCDLQMRQCGQTSVFGRQIVESEKVSCQLESFTVGRNNAIRSDDIANVPASVETLFEVKCQLPRDRIRKSADTAIRDDVIAQGYNISISNDGYIFSDEDMLIIYDSACVTCSKSGSNINCSVTSGFCISDGNCYMVGQTYGCYSCYGDTLNGVTWVAGNDCQQVEPPESENTVQGWLIGVLTSICVIMAVLITICFCYFKNRADVAKSKSMTNIQSVCAENQTKSRFDQSIMH